MKQVIFICLLSAAVCLSSPITEGKPEGVQATPTGSPATEQSQLITSNRTNPPLPTPKPAPTDTVKEKITAQDVSTTKTDTNNQTAKNNNGTAETEIDNKITSSNSTEPKNPKTNPANITTPSTPATPATPNTTIPSVTEKMSSTTANVKPADTPSKEGENLVKARGFDGASFIGGIILTLGLLAIGFMGFKYYQNQTARNYHTL